MSEHLVGPVDALVEKNIHGALHQFIDETRKEWKDTTPFGTWLGVCKRFSLWELHIIRGSVRGSKARSPARLFFYKLRQARKKA